MFSDIKTPGNLGGPKKNRREREQLKDMAKPLRPDETVTLNEALNKKSKKAHLSRLKQWWRQLNRNVRFGIIAFGLLLFGATAIGYYYFSRPMPEPSIEITRREKPVVTTVASPLTGVQVEPELAKRPVTGIMIENSTDARPQSGIEQAGVVFEAIAEGGITRFLTLYQESQPQYIGPVRSLRPYYIDWAGAFDAPIAHVGGSPDALSQIRGGGKDLDQFFNAGAYWRQSTRASPHNVYTSFERLDALNKSKGYTSSKFNPWARKKDEPLAKPTATTVNVNISSALYNSRYDYDSASNSYARNQGGQAHIAIVSPTDKTGQQLRFKVIVALIMSYGLNGKYSVYSVNGSGAALVFQDGGAVDATWSKSDRASQIKLTDSAGKDLKLNAGQTWVVALASRDRVSYSGPPAQ